MTDAQHPYSAIGGQSACMVCKLGARLQAEREQLQEQHDTLQVCCCVREQWVWRVSIAFSGQVGCVLCA
jgi:hypothetical protein